MASTQYTALHDFKVKVSDTEEKAFTAGDDYDGPNEFIENLLTHHYDVNKGPLIAKKSSGEAKQATADAKEQAKVEKAQEAAQADAQKSETEGN